MRAGLQTIDAAARWSGLLGVMRARAVRGLTILMYHRVLPAAEAGAYPLANLVVTREAFERQVAWLARRSRVVTLGQGVEELAAGRAGADRPLVVLTFDDGYADNAVHAAPVLEAHKLRGTFFVTTGFVEGWALWFDRAAWYHGQCARGCRPEAPPDAFRLAEPHLRSLDAWLGWLKTQDTQSREEILSALGAGRAPDGCAPMTVEQVAGLAARGHEIGGHTCTHPVLTVETPEVVEREIAECRRKIEAWTGRPVRGFCYPNGSTSPDVRSACARAGYEYATTTQRCINLPGADPFTLGRRFIAPDSTGAGDGGASFAAEVFGLHDLMRGGLRGRRARWRR